MTYLPPEPEPGYRLLAQDEDIQEGDMYWDYGWESNSQEGELMYYDRHDLAYWQRETEKRKWVEQVEVAVWTAPLTVLFPVAFPGSTRCQPCVLLPDGWNIGQVVRVTVEEL